MVENNVRVSTEVLILRVSTSKSQKNTDKSLFTEQPG